MKKKIAALAAALAMAGTLSAACPAEQAEEQVTYLAAEEVLESGAKFVTLDFDGTTVYAYQPSELYYSNRPIMPVFYYYAGETLSAEQAGEKLKETGLLDLAEEEKAAIYVFSPSDGGYDAETDYQAFRTAAAVMQNNDSLALCGLEYAKLEPRRWYVFAEVAGADFVMETLVTDNAASGTIAGIVLAGAQAVPETYGYAVPAYVSGSDESVAEVLCLAAETDTEEMADGRTVYYNSSYVTDSGYTPKRVIVGSEETDTLNPDLVGAAWEILLRKTCRAPLASSYLSEEGESCSVLEWAVPEELDLTYRMQYDEDGTLTPDVPDDDYNVWHEWIPNEALDSDNTDTYPLVVVCHGKGDNPVFTAEMNGWVALAGEERVIVVGLQDIYQNGRPPEAAETRYGMENAAFIRNVICEELPVDMSRIYIMGFSIGGFVTADTAAADPGLFAAMAPLAYPGDGHMEIFPYDAYDELDGGDRAAQYDIPMLYACGRADFGNTMTDPTGATDGKVSSAQLLINQVLTFNGMTDQLIPLKELDYEWYPGEHDVNGLGDGTGYEVDGVQYDTYASYVAGGLDFETYEFIGFDPTETSGAVKSEFTTGEGIEVDKYVYCNEAGQPMVEQLLMGNMGHNQYSRYARLIWDDLFSHYARNPETGELIYTA